ncbi:aromatic-ring-hydroxylating dioxygenase subunit beta [Streptomyces sp. NPDC101455]|uniref:aromatic-ring-hydroxylating dioxygenase subunit beta n=1 Tax=Streptomyces sp. NPDC101455 TaxID=3366142 RepID=UPI00382CA299
MSVQPFEVTQGIALPPLVDLQTEREVTQLLHIEAELLDQTRYVDWFNTCIAEDLEYLVPIRTTRERKPGASEFATDSYHMRDTYNTMKSRVLRLLTEHAWAEDPASRTRRVVSNIRVEQLGVDEVLAKSYLTLYRSQWDTVDYDLILAERVDNLRKTDGRWRLTRREVFFSHTVLGTANLGVFL